jgi:sugar-phosphatase
MPDIAAVLFDMDGTLVDSNAAVARTWAHWSAQRGIDPAVIAAVTPGRPADESIAELAPWLSAAEQAVDAAELLRREREDLADVVATRGALELIAALDGWAVPWAVVTSADDPLAKARLGAAGIPQPDILVTASTVTRGKPHPEGFLDAAARLHTPAGACLVVEDSSAGVRAGLAAGSVVVAVAPVPDAHVIVTGLDELHRRLDRTDTGLALA